MFICSCEQAKLLKNFQPARINLADVNAVYSELRVHTSELQVNSKLFRGFDHIQLNKARQHLKVNGYIFDCELNANGVDGEPGYLR